MPIFDPTLEWRRRRSEEINAGPQSREELELRWGEVLDHLQLRQGFNQFFFANPVLVCRRKSDGQKGTFLFQFSPRYYFRWRPYENEQD